MPVPTHCATPNEDRAHACRVEIYRGEGVGWLMPRIWLEGGLSEEDVNGGPGVCLGDGQTEAYLMDMGMTGLASVWTMARRKPIWRIWA